MLERKFVVNLRSKFLMFMVFGAIFAGGVARAQCCWCDAADRCDVGMVVVGYTLVNEPICESCSGLSGYTGCLHCNCYGYDHPCPSGVHTGAKCLKMDCPGSCTGYKVCYPWLNTDPEELVIGDCHLENNTCYSNTRACRNFPNHVEPVDGTTLSCNSENQHNQAIWQENQNAWYTRNCECKVENAEITGLFRCERAMSRAYVKDSNALVTHSVNDDIVYTLDYTYCAKCHAGYLPNIVTGSNAHYFRPSGGSGNWGVLACGTKVTVPDYAPGCVINFGLATGDDVIAECRGICPTGFKTLEDGKTSIDDCEPKYTPSYEDSTGTFVLTSLDSCP